MGLVPRFQEHPCPLSCPRFQPGGAWTQRTRFKCTSLANVQGRLGLADQEGGPFEVAQTSKRPRCPFPAALSGPAFFPCPYRTSVPACRPPAPALGSGGCWAGALVLSASSWGSELPKPFLLLYLQGWDVRIPCPTPNLCSAASTRIHPHPSARHTHASGPRGGPAGRSSQRHPHTPPSRGQLLVCTHARSSQVGKEAPMGGPRGGQGTGGGEGTRPQQAQSQYRFRCFLRPPGARGEAVACVSWETTVHALKRNLSN